MHKTIDVLVIDDCDTDWRITRAAVRRAAPSASLVRVKDGGQALRLMFHKGLFTNAPHVPRLIVLGLNVPMTNVADVLQRLHHETDASRIPVIVLTSSRNRQVIEQSHALGARECLLKPDDADDYLSEVTRAIRRYLV